MTEGTTGLNFVHLHNHSFFSIFDGLSSPLELAKAAKVNGFHALALTDHGTCGGLYSFQKACVSEGIKPILGNEFYITKDHRSRDKNSRTFHVTILAKNKVGLQNIMRLSSVAELEGKYKKPRIDFELLSKYSEGLICLSGCPSGELSMSIWQENKTETETLLDNYKSLFGDDYYLEIMTHKYNEKSKNQEEREKKVAREIYSLSKKYDIKAVCTNDAHYANIEDAEYHDILLALQTKKHIKDPKRFSFDGTEFYIKSYEEMKAIYGRAPELLSNTVEIAEKIETELIKEGADLLPEYSYPPEFKSDVHYLKELVSDGMRSYGFMKNPEYRARILFEMEAIERCGYIRYFLILWDIINFANQQGIRVGAGRGSAAGSLTLYVLGITKLDPIKYELLFERFINPERISPPDVDIDFDYYRRDEIYDYVYRKYGNEYCCKIGTYISLKAKNTIRYVAKVLDLGNDWEIYQGRKEKNPNIKYDMTKNSLDIADYVSKTIENDPGITLTKSFENNTEFQYAISKYPRLLDVSLRLEGTVSSAGVHAAGILVCKDPVTDHVALRDNKGQVCSCFDGPEVEDLGLLKFDFLALKTLFAIEDTVQMVKARQGIDIDIDGLEPDDKAVFKLLNGGYHKIDNRGIFQFESDGIQEMLRNIKVDSFEDMIASNALYRPGPLGAKVKGKKIPQLYADYKHGVEEVVPLHPEMGEIMKKTYGLIVFQEDFMKVAQKMAGFTKGESDVLRKAVGKKKLELLAQQKNKFVDGCVKNDINRKIAEAIFAQIEFFGGYGFNRSHSASYALIAYQTAYLKHYYPTEFMCALLSSEIKNNDKNIKLNSYMHQARDMGIVIKGADINNSGLKYKIEHGVRKTNASGNKGEEYEFIRSPLTTLSGVGNKAVEAIVEHQPFDNLNQFLHKVDGRKMNSRIFETLARQGCMTEAFKLSSDRIMAQYDSVKVKVKKEKDAIKKEKDEEEEFGGNIFDKLASG
tara:strand:- start:39472 stop:42408 length:2937 start_codon:yes stop_codon:yes gene_type:complete